MEGDMLHAAGQALLIILDPIRLVYLFAGVCMGLALGILPGIGGVAGTALLLPFTFNMDAPAAFALLLGLGATTATADPISGDPVRRAGHAASAATVLDGYPMAKRGEAGRALGASYMSALIGGIFGAALMAVALPILRPDHPVHGLAGAARDLGVRRFDGRVAVRQCAAARRGRRLLRHDALDDRHRPADRARCAGPWTRSICGTGLPLVPVDARHLRAARTVRSRDRPHGGGRGRQDDRHQDRHAARRQGLLHALVADPALLVARRRARARSPASASRSSTGSPTAMR